MSDYDENRDRKGSESDPWNSGPYENDPRAPWNDERYKDDPTKAWNSESGDRMGY